MSRVACWSFLASSLLVLTAPLAAEEIDFAHDVAPLLNQYCGKCHTGEEKKGGLSFNTRQSLLSGGESGPAAAPGKSGESELLARIVSDDDDFEMPPEGPRMPAEKVALVRAWIDAGLPWEDGFTFGKRAYEPPLRQRRPDLPPAVDGRTNPVDRIIDAYLAERKLPRPEAVDDGAFARRAYLDLIGLLPTPEELQAFVDDRGSNNSGSDKRTRLVQELLARDVDYAEHWLTFWNDLLRNDYTGAGFITGGRKQISKWLYEALVTNKPYDQFARELIAPPTPESAGFGEGIRWRGDVSAGQTVEIQFAQSVGQALLGINLKCASCHDSFIDRWKLEESYGLAAVFATRPLEIHRCDKPIGKQAVAGWLFPELGQVDPAAPQPERLKQLAALMTHPENGRFTRTIVNRLWQRLMGRGIVHPVDAMQSEPWSADLLDELAVYLADSGYDLKQTIELIATSQAYQSQVEAAPQGADEQSYVYRGPRGKRMTAEQFVDAVWQLTGQAPARYDAPVLRGKPNPHVAQAGLTGKWIWSRADASQAAAGETVVFRKQWNLKSVPQQAVAAISCDNSYELFVNGQRAAAGDNWQQPGAVLLANRLKAGMNELLIVAKNGGQGPNPAGLFFEARLFDAEEAIETIASDAAWQWTAQQPERNGRFKTEPADWQPAALVERPEVWAASLEAPLTQTLDQAGQAAGLMVRASLVKSDFLMRSLGRPNRDQIVSVRPDELTTLEAIDLSNGQQLADMLTRGARRLVARPWQSPRKFIAWLYQFALSRQPTADEANILAEAVGPALTQQNVEDVLWSVIMLPEFHLVR
ncbi:MAG TPA: DUF1549 domain-containing protein [Pirellulales bacterium]|nr:DUF1549 domain-containing protein [Pirellulales bacterium]